MDFLKDKTKYVSNESNPNCEVLYLVTLMLLIFVIHLI